MKHRPLPGAIVITLPNDIANSSVESNTTTRSTDADLSNNSTSTPSAAPSALLTSVPNNPTRSADGGAHWKHPMLLHRCPYGHAGMRLHVTLHLILRHSPDSSSTRSFWVYCDTKFRLPTEVSCSTLCLSELSIHTSLLLNGSPQLPAPSGQTFLVR